MLKAQTVKGGRHLPVGAGNFLLRVCSRTRPVCDSAPGCPCAVPPRGKAAVMDRSLPSSSALPCGKLQTETGPGMEASGSNTKEEERKRESAAILPIRQTGNISQSIYSPSAADTGVFLLGFHYKYLLLPLYLEP